MKLERRHRHVLRFIFEHLARSGRVNPVALRAAFRGSQGELARVLAELDALALVDATRLRLTLAGLAVAVATRARRGETDSVN